MHSGRNAPQLIEYAIETARTILDQAQLKHATSEELLGEARTGSPGAWEELVRRYGGVVMAVTRELALTPADRDEAFQATWVAFYEQLDLIRNPDALVAWLATTATRQAWRIRRAARREKGLDVAEGNDLETLATPLEAALHVERRQAVRAAVEELGPTCRSLLTRLFMDADSPEYEDVASELGMKLGSVGPTRIRCLAKLAGILERNGFH